MNAVARRILSREKTTTTWRADRTRNIKLRENRSLAGQPIEVWRFDGSVAIAAKITPPQIIGKHKDHVRSLGFPLGSRLTRDHQQPTKQAQGNHTSHGKAFHKKPSFPISIKEEASYQQIASVQSGE